MKKKLIQILIFSFCGNILVLGQSGHSSFSFLKLPSSSHANALGGSNISIVGTDVSMVFQNPALLGPEMDNQLSLNYMNFISDINIGSTIYSRAFNENGAWSIGAQYADYGRFDMTSADNQITGTFSAKDMLFAGSIGYNITSALRGGATAKFIYSGYESYSSIALAVDLGLNYYDYERDMSISVVARNLGGQLKSYAGTRESMPFDLLFGFSKSLSHAPFRFSFTMIDLTDWQSISVDNSNVDTSESVAKKDNFAKKFFRHLIIGADYMPGDNFYVSLGYSYKARTDFDGGGGGFFTGFSGGAGIKIRMFDINASIARYHRSGTSLMIGINLLLNER